MKRVCIFALLLAVMLTFTACDEKTPGPDMTKPSTQPTAETKNNSQKLQNSLSIFRRDMGQTIVAVADFGFPELSEAFEIMDYLLDEYPIWMADHDFIGDIPEERVIRTCGYEDWGNLLCVVPRDPEATVRIEITRYMDISPYEKVDAVYHSESGEPILLLADISEEIAITVWITDSEGENASYIPYWDSLSDDKFTKKVMDFSPLSEKTAYDNAVDYGWMKPHMTLLAGSLWHSDWGYELELCDNPGEVYDGEAYIYEDDGTSTYEITYKGYWRYSDGMLHLNMENSADHSIVIQEAFPVLTDPFKEGWLGIFRTAEGVGLPQFYDLEYDELSPIFF